MIKIESAKNSDFTEINNILDKLNLGYPSQGNKYFWTAKKENKIVGIVQCLIFDNFFFIANLGVLPEYRKQNIGKNLIETSTNNYEKDVYLYTIISDYFKKIEFINSDLLPTLPKKTMFDCSTCIPNKCACMVKYAK